MTFSKNSLPNLPPNTQSGATIAVKAGIECDNEYGAVTPPLYLSSNYTFSEFGKPRHYDYTRSGNPTRDLLADAITQLEGGSGGVITSTGMSAVLLVTHLLTAKDILIAPHDCYGGTYRLLKNLSEKGHFQIRFIDQNDPIKLNKVLEEKPKLIWVETPSNPLLRVVDIEKIVDQAKPYNCLVAVDNTFLTPAFQKPLSFGADLVVHSTTKYINGHSDVVGGCVIANTLELADNLKWWANCLGITASPFDSFLTLRGLRTLNVRLKQHQANTQELLAFLNNHPQVEKIYHPSLPQHPGHLIAKKQQSSFGIMVSFEIKGNEEEVKTFVETLQLFSLAESLGGVESLICHPATMTHAAMDPTERKVAGINDNLIRISVGVEDSEDLINDLSRSFIAADQCQRQQKVS